MQENIAVIPVMEGEIETYYNSTINKLCNKNEGVLFSRYQHTANATVLSDIDDNGPREKVYIL